MLYHGSSQRYGKGSERACAGCISISNTKVSLCYQCRSRDHTPSLALVLRSRTVDQLTRPAACSKSVPERSFACPAPRVAA